MDEVKNLLTVTLVVMAAGSSIYTIKTYMKPGMDLNINLEEGALQDELRHNSTDLSTTLPPTSLDNGLNTIALAMLGVENNTIALELPSEKAFNKTSNSTSADRKRSLSSKELLTNSIEGLGQVVGKSESSSSSKAIVTTSLGKIEGTQLNVLGKHVFAYLGVPYAQAPTKKLRFKKPVPVVAWSGKQAAKDFGKACLQVGWQRNQSSNTNAEVELSENCLNLNIWTPCSGTSNPLPVFFFIHGGSFTQGSSSADQTDGRVLAALQNMVVVSANYRLGPLGFLNLDKEEGSNLGLHDLVEALKWTRHNIKYFGGNADAITVVGHSSGALASALLLTSPETKHLFKRAILQSGSSTVFNFYYQQSQKSSEEFASLLGCLQSTERITSANQETVWRCVQNANTTELERAMEKQFARDSYSYAPRIGDSLLPSSPKTLLEDLRPEVGKKEILIGTNSNEAAFFVNMGYPQLFTKKSPSLKDLEEVRQFLSASLKDWGISRRTLRLINSFFLEKSATVEPKVVLRSMYDIFGDLTFTCPTLHFAEKFSARQNHSSYFYYYSHNQTRGASLASDELPYVFGYPLRYPHKYSGQDIDFSKKIMNIWATFIRTGKPPLVNGSDWPQYSTESQSYVELGEKEFRVMHQLPGNASASNAANSTVHRFNCDTWKHAFKIFT